MRHLPPRKILAARATSIPWASIARILMDSAIGRAAMPQMILRESNPGFGHQSIAQRTIQVNARVQAEEWPGLCRDRAAFGLQVRNAWTRRAGAPRRAQVHASVVGQSWLNLAMLASVVGTLNRPGLWGDSASGLFLKPREYECGTWVTGRSSGTVDRLCYGVECTTAASAAGRWWGKRCPGYCAPARSWQTLLDVPPDNLGSSKLE